MPRYGRAPNTQLAGQHIGSDFGLAIVLFVERQMLPGFQFIAGRLLNGVVEAGDQNFALLIFQLADNFHQAEDRIRSSSAVDAGVQIGLRALRFDFGVDQSAQADAQCR